MTTVKKLFTIIKDELAQAGIENPPVETELILSHFLALKRSNLYLEPDRIIQDEIHNHIKQVVKNRCNRYPLQYLLGSVEFADVILTLNPHVLIPRPETEQMVELILAQNSAQNLQILDLACGSGAIALALKKARPSWQITASDISIQALETARMNANNNNCPINLIHSDLWNNINGNFDIITCNPPYISHQEYKTLAPELFYEPEIALKAEDNGLFFLKKIIKSCSSYMKKNAALYLETGADQKNELIHFIEVDSRFAYKFYQDYNRYFRFLKLTSS